MKENLHPKYYPDAKVTCACGSAFTVGSTLPEIRVEVCSACHPFFTGQEKFVDTEGRVDRFEKQRKNASEESHLRTEKDKKIRLDRAKKEKEAAERPKTLKEMLAKLERPNEPASEG